MKTTNTVMAALMSASLLSAPMVHADDTAPWLNVQGEVNVDTKASSANDFEANLRVDASLRFEVLLREGIKAVIKARIEQELVKDGARQTIQDVDLDKMIEDAYFEIDTDKLSGLPRAIIRFGKQEMAFGQDITQLPMFRDSMLWNLANEREMIGLTVALPVNFFNVIDEIAVSLYETGAGDFKVSDSHGVSVKLSKRITDRIQAQVSGLIKENEGQTETEKRASFGFVFTSADGTYKVWAQGLVFDHNPTMPTTDWGSQVGGSMKLGPGTVVLDYQYLNKYAHEVALAYNLPIGSSLILSPEVRHKMYDDSQMKKDETIVGVRARILVDRNMNKKLKPRGN